MKTLLVIGFPHSGITMLRKVLGRCKGVYEHPVEEHQLTQKIIDKAGKNKAIAIKYPMPVNYWRPEYHGYEKIFIFRNPSFVMSSINRRKAKNDPGHTIEYLESAGDLWLHKRGTPRLRCIRYEDLWARDKTPFKELLYRLGLNFSRDIFDGNNNPGPEPRSDLVDPYRLWQVNQPIHNMNYPEKIELTEQQKEFIVKSEVFNKIYPEGALRCKNTQK